MHPRICRCCGGKISVEIVTVNPNVCADCERWLEDDSPLRAAANLAAEPLAGPAAVPEVSPQREEIGSTSKTE